MALIATAVHVHLVLLGKTVKQILMTVRGFQIHVLMVALVVIPSLHLSATVHPVILGIVVR